MNAEDFMEEMLNRIKALSKDINEKVLGAHFVMFLELVR